MLLFFSYYLQDVLFSFPYILFLLVKSRADPGLVGPKVYTSWKPSLRKIMQNYEFSSSYALEEACTREGPEHPA